MDRAHKQTELQEHKNKRHTPQQNTNKIFKKNFKQNTDKKKSKIKNKINLKKEVYEVKQCKGNAQLSEYMCLCIEKISSYFY